MVALSSYSRGFHFTINCWQSIVVCYLIPGPLPCPEVVAVFYIRPAEVPTLSSVEGDAQVERQNNVVGFLTQKLVRQAGTTVSEKELLLQRRELTWYYHRPILRTDPCFGQSQIGHTSNTEYFELRMASELLTG